MMATRCVCRLLLAAGACLLLLPVALAGIDVSLDREVSQLQQLEQLLEDIKSVNSDEELKAMARRWEQLRGELERLGGSDGSRPDVRAKEIRNFKDEVEQLGSQLHKFREDVLRYFPRAANRVAVFTYDDSAATGAGDALSFIASKHLLFSTRVTSFAIVNFQQGASPERPDDIGYFDKVDKLTKDQDYSMAVWGRIIKAGKDLTIETYGQAYHKPKIGRYAVALSLPDAMGGEALKAGLVHDRFQLDALTIPAEALADFERAAKQIRVLRENPLRDSATVGQLTEGKPYFIAESKGSWVRLQVRGGSTGWTSVREFCLDACARFLGAIDFANDIVAAGAGLAPGRPADRLSPDTRFVYRELAALHALDKQPAKAAELSRDYPSLGTRGTGLANIELLANIKTALPSPTAPDYSGTRLGADYIRAQANALKDVFSHRPQARYTGANLRLLLDYVGDRAASQRAAFLASPKHALVIGNGEYGDGNALRDAASEATRMHKALASSGYESTLIINGTGRQIMRELGRLADKAPQDTVVIFFSGLSASEADRLFVVPVDGDFSNLRETAVAVDDIVSRAHPDVLLFDSQIADALLDANRSAWADAGVSMLVPAIQAYTDPVDIGVGVFPYFLSQGLAGGADVDGDGFIDIAELGEFVQAEAGRNSLTVPVRSVLASRESPAIVGVRGVGVRGGGPTDSL